MKIEKRERRKEIVKIERRDKEVRGEWRIKGERRKRG